MVTDNIVIWGQVHGRFTVHSPIFYHLHYLLSQYLDVNHFYPVITGSPKLQAMTPIFHALTAEFIRLLSAICRQENAALFDRFSS